MSSPEDDRQKQERDALRKLLNVLNSAATVEDKDHKPFGPFTESEVSALKRVAQKEIGKAALKTLFGEVRYWVAISAFFVTSWFATKAGFIEWLKKQLSTGS